MPTLVVLGLGLQAVSRQREAIDTLTATARRVQQALVVEQVERRLLESAETAIGHLASAGLVALASAGDQEQAARAWPLVKRLLVEHPVMQHVFVMEDGESLYPRATPLVPNHLDAWIAAEPPSPAMSFQYAIDRAETLDAQQAWLGAAEWYRTGSRAAVARRLQAVALGRAARAYARAGAMSNAEAAYAQLFVEFGDTYDLAGRPNALVAALELRRPRDPTLLGALHAVPGQLAEGRWAMDADTASYFMTELASADTSPGQSEYLATLSFAQLLRQEFSQAINAAPGVTHAATLAGRPPVSLLYRTIRVPDGARAPAVAVGFVVNTDWVRRVLVPDVVAGVAPGSSGSLVPGPEGTRFSTALSGSAVRLAGPAGGSRSGAGSAVVFGLTTAAVLGVLVMGVLLLTRDVSRESALNRVRADLVGGVSHDLRTPLSIMRVYAETLADSPDLTGDERRKYANVIAAETQRLSQLIEGVIDFSRVEQGARTYRLVPGMLTAVVAEAAERYRVFLESHGFGFDVQLDPLAPPVSFDADAASQAVLNLLDNAYKYSGESRHIALRLHTTSTRVVVEIVDRGPGILPDEATRLFEQFERGATHPERGGYGLGLYLVRHTMEAHGGTVELGRDPEGRTVARLLFPIVHGEA